MVPCAVFFDTPGSSYPVSELVPVWHSSTPLRENPSMWHCDCHTVNGDTMKLVKFAIPAVVLAAGLLVSSTASFAKPEDTKKTKKPCTFCHVSAKGGKDLTEAGKYYKDKKSLDGYEAKK
jgi:hypothetical protein